MIDSQAPLRAIVNGIKAVVQNSSVLTRRLLIWLFLHAILMFVLQANEHSLLIQIVGGVVALLIYVAVSVVTHRTILLKEVDDSSLGLNKPGVREWQFFLALFEVMFYCLPCIIFVFIPYVGEYLAIVVGAYIVSRISLIFPSIAIDAPMSVRASWQATKASMVTMFAVVFLFSMFFALVEWVLERSRAPGLLIELFSLLTVVFLVAALSEAYREIMTELDM